MARTKLIQIRTSEVERALLTRLAQTEQRPSSELFRDWLYSRATAAGIWPPVVNQTEENSRVKA